MKSLSSLGIGLSFVFGLLLLAFIAELYYLLWWKKKAPRREIEDDYSSSTKEIFFLLCKRKSSTLVAEAVDPKTPDVVIHCDESDNQQLKPFDEDGLDAEIMWLQNLCGGPPRFLFTIKEETNEDLESDDGKSNVGNEKIRKGSRSFSDLVVAIETPYLTPRSSPSVFTPPLTPLGRYHQHGYNPLFESSTGAEVNEMNRIRSSPPPKFKFLRDAEDKLYKKTLMDRSKRFNQKNGGPVEGGSSSSSTGLDEQEGSFITIIIGKNKGKEKQSELHTQQHQYHSSSSSQVLPLPCSPSDITPANTG